MPEEQQQEKTEPATPKRRQETREKGNVAKSIEFNSAFILLIGMLFFYFAGGWLMSNTRYIMQIIFENADSVVINADNVQGYLVLAVGTVFRILGPVFGVFLVVGLAVNLFQVGFLLAPKALEPKWNKINPLSGFKRVLGSKKAFIELLKGILKILIVGIMAYFALSSEMVRFIRLMDQEPVQILQFIGDRVFFLGLKISLILLAMALFDFMFQRWDHANNMKMTKQEVRDELKQMEGDPQIKARIRSIQRDVARQRMMSEIPEADVVVTNPTHIAVALKYNSDDMEAPVVVAKGARLIAEKIKEMAREAGIPIIENKPLARALFKMVEVGDEIPDELFKAVAEVLATVYRMQGKGAPA